MPSADHIDRVPVLVAGAGPAGLVTAATLARNGVGSLLVERNPGLSPLPRATAVSTRTMELLRSWGLEDEVRAGQLALDATDGWAVETLASPFGTAPQAAAAKQVCAGCAVRGPCLEQALHGAQAHQDHSGIFAGTTPSDRVRLRGRASMAQGTRFLQERAAAEQALELANQVSIDRAARQLGVSKQALRRAFDHHGLPQPQGFQGGPQRTRFYQDREAAEQAWRRAAEVGFNQTRKELGVSDRALRTAWRRHGLGLPPRTAAAAAATRGLDPAFLALNRRLLPARERPAQELAAWVRREEEYATLGAEVVVELNSESRTRRPATRAWAIIRRAQRAHRRTSDREHRSQRRQADRTSGKDRTSRSHHAQERGMVADAR